MVRPGYLPGSGRFGFGVGSGILGGIARVGFSHREIALPDPLNYQLSEPRMKAKSTPRETGPGALPGAVPINGLTEPLHEPFDPRPKR